MEVEEERERKRELMDFTRYFKFTQLTVEIFFIFLLLIVFQSDMHCDTEKQNRNGNYTSGNYNVHEWTARSPGRN